MNGIDACLHTAKGDVFAVGLMMWEMWTRVPPSLSLMHIPPEQLKERIQVGLRAPISADCPAGLMTLIIQSWRGNPELRISANQALTLACKPSLLAPFVCRSWSDIVKAIESEFWKDTPLRQHISEQLKALTQEDIACGGYAPRCPIACSGYAPRCNKSFAFCKHIFCFVGYVHFPGVFCHVS